jgi:hypothetical protein
MGWGEKSGVCSGSKAMEVTLRKVMIPSQQYVAVDVDAT